MLVVLTGVPPMVAGLNFHAHEAAIAAFRSSGGPERARDEVTFPCSLTLTSTVTTPLCCVCRADGGYDGWTLLTATAGTTPGDDLTVLGGGSGLVGGGSAGLPAAIG